MYLRKEYMAVTIEAFTPFIRCQPQLTVHGLTDYKLPIKHIFSPLKTAGCLRQPAVNVPDEIRTHGPSLRRRMLYPAELQEQNIVHRPVDS